MKFVEIQNQSFLGTSGKKNGEFQRIKFAGDSEPTFGGASGAEKIGIFTV